MYAIQTILLYNQKCIKKIASLGFLGLNKNNVFLPSLSSTIPQVQKRSISKYRDT